MPWKARAFGLEIELDFDAPGLAPASLRCEGPECRVELGDERAIDDSWPARDARRVLEERSGDADPERTIDAHPSAGYRLYARGFGLARLSPDGARVLCSPPHDEAWRWQRFLVGRVLPWAAVLRGLEPLHASAVVIDGGAIAFVGATGAGKTSLALELASRDATFLTDDVLALDIRGGALRAHPGAALASARDADPPTGTALGHDDKTYLALPRADRPVPLRAVYFLRSGSPGDPAITPVDPVDPRLLLANTFVLGVQTPERRLRQLDVCAEVVRSAPLFHLTVQPGVGAAGLSEAVRSHVAELSAAAADAAA